jgi:hypothetical protein
VQPINAKPPTIKGDGHLKGLSNSGFLTLRMITIKAEIAKANNVPKLAISPRVLMGVKPAIIATEIVTNKQLK